MSITQYFSQTGLLIFSLTTCSLLACSSDESASTRPAGQAETIVESEQADATKANADTTKTDAVKDSFEQKKFKIVNPEIKKPGFIPKVQFTSKTTDGKCTYQVNAKPLKWISNSALKKENLNPNWSPIRIMEKDTALKTNISKKKFGDDCIGGFRSDGEVITYSPSSSKVKPSDLSLALATDFPIRTKEGPVYWIYRDATYVGKLRRSKIGEGEKVTLRIKIAYYGKVTRAPKLFINDTPYTFNTDATPGFATAEIPVPNADAALKYKIRFFNYARIEEISLSSETTPVYYVNNQKSE